MTPGTGSLADLRLAEPSHHSQTWLDPSPVSSPLDSPTIPGSDVPAFPTNRPNPTQVGISLVSCVLYWKGIECYFLLQLCFSIKMFAFNSWSTDFVLGCGALFVLWLQVPPALCSEVFEKFEKLGLTRVNVHTPWLAFKALRSGLCRLCCPQRPLGLSPAPSSTGLCVAPPNQYRLLQAPTLLFWLMSTHPSGLDSAPSPPGSPPGPQMGLSALPCPPSPPCLSHFQCSVRIMLHMCPLYNPADDKNPIQIILSWKKRWDGLIHKTGKAWAGQTWE